MPSPNFQNRTLYHGDNLAFLRGMNSETVHLVATDPPFNKSRDFHATPDSLADGASFQDRWSWRDDIHDEWLTKIRDEHPEVWNAVMAAKTVYGDDLAAYLCFMGVRVIEMHRVLRHDGSLYLHCDPTASHYLKMLLDAVFGKSNFRNEIVWCYNVGGKSKRWWARKHDIILFYTRGSDYHFNGRAAGIPRDTGSKSFGGRIGKDEAGRPYQDKIVKSTGKVYRYYLDEPKIPEDWWTDINSLQSRVKERTGYPTQKPLALYERIIKASSNEGDMVLDPFCGCATTPVAAEKLNRQWVGIDLWDKAHETVLSRLAMEGLAADEVNPDLERQGRFGFDAVHYETEPPARTDGGDEAVADIQTPTGRKRARHPRPRLQHGKLLEQFGGFCQGCGRDYRFDPRVLEVDHIRPKSDGGSDAYDNLTLLCPPCNRVKMDRMTLTGLQSQNRRDGHLLPENEKNLKLGRKAPKRRR